MMRALVFGFFRGVLLCPLLLSLSISAYAKESLVLYVADTPRPWVIGGCRMLPMIPKQRMASDPWIQVTSPVQLNWEGGGMRLNANGGEAIRSDALTEHCFRLDLDGKMLVGGAIVSRHSARLLNFPVLLASDDVKDQPPELRLQPFLGSGQPDLHVLPVQWLDTLQQRFPAGSAD